MLKEIEEPLLSELKQFLIKYSFIGSLTPNLIIKVYPEIHDMTGTGFLYPRKEMYAAHTFALYNASKQTLRILKNHYNLQSVNKLIPITPTPFKNFDY